MRALVIFDLISASNVVHYLDHRRIAAILLAMYLLEEFKANFLCDQHNGSIERLRIELNSLIERATELGLPSERLVQAQEILNKPMLNIGDDFALIADLLNQAQGEVGARIEELVAAALDRAAPAPFQGDYGC